MQVPRSLSAVLLALRIAMPAHADEVTDGKQVFQTYCSICHTFQPGRNLTGPSLFGVVNRHAGSAPGFLYTLANRQSGLTWDVATLDRYLTAPRELVPGTAMTFPGLKDPGKRAAVISFLKTLK
ncbi:MAG: cytochrome c family protein [Acetobacteraceae bacterium]|nr:cytochrome c family protein [Acetobacteraceae bacterium]